MTVHALLAATVKFVFGADLDLLVNPKEDDIKFLNKVDQLFEGMGRLAYELPLYKVYKNNLYHFYMDAVNVIFFKGVASVMYIHYLQWVIAHGSKYANRLQEKMEKGESSEVQGLLEQWLREKKLSTEDAVAMSSTMLTAGVHTVCLGPHGICLDKFHMMYLRLDCLSVDVPSV